MMHGFIAQTRSPLPLAGKEIMHFGYKRDEGGKGSLKIIALRKAF